MATYGLKGFYIGSYSEDDTNGIVYSEGKKIRKACNVEVSFTTQEGKLYADNALAEKKKVVTEVALTVTPDAFDEDTLALIGIEKQTVKINGTETSMYARTGNAEGEFVGFGYIVPQTIDGIDTYVAKIVSKCKFTPNESESLATQGESVTFSTPAFTGTGYQDKYGNYTYEGTYETEAAAEEAIKTFLGATTTQTTSE